MWLDDSALNQTQGSIYGSGLPCLVIWTILFQQRLAEISAEHPVLGKLWFF